MIKGKESYGTLDMKIDFPGGIVETGDIIYVTLDGGGGRYMGTGIYFNLTSKNLFSVKEIDLIR